MKKFIAIALAAVLCLAALCACTAQQPAPAEPEEPAEQEAPAEQETPIGMPNPVSEMSQSELAEKTGLNLEAPEGAENTVWNCIDQGEDKDAMAELVFTLDGQEYFYRAQQTAELESYDMSGLFYEWTEEKSDSVSERDAKVCVADEAGCIYWLDVAPGVNYTLGSKTAVSADKLIEVANKIFVSVQGEA